MRISTRSAASSIVRQQQPASLARRLLFPHIQPGADLPPLFLSPACPPELNDEVYDLIALALRAFVNTWWAKLSRYDREFIPQIASILTHVIHSLERRFLDADLALLVFCDIPALVTQHCRDYRQAVSKASTSYATGGALSVPQLFHQLQPHMAISSDGVIDEEYFRQIFDHVLKECLPTEDYAPEAERSIIREIVLKVVVKDVIPQITQPWFVQKTMLDALGLSPAAPLEEPNHSRVSKSGVIVVLLSAIQRLSGACIALIHAYKHIVHIIPLVSQTQAHDLAPDLTRGPLELVSEVLCVRERLAATALVHVLSLFCCSFQTFMNKLLCYILYTHVLSTSCLLLGVRASKRALFPNGYPTAAAAEPTAEEQAVIREQLVRRVAERIPAVLLGDGTAAEDVVAVLGNAACNRHLAVCVLDAVVLGIFPELSIGGGS